MIRTHYLWKIRPYYRQVGGLLALGFASGIIMNIAVVLPPILLGRAIDTVLALEKGNATYHALFIASVVYVGGCSLNLLAQIGKRWWLRTANRRTVANMRANALRGILAWPMEQLHQESVGDMMARIVGDTQVFMVGFNEATTELLDTWLFSISLFTAMMFYDARLALIAMAPVPLAFVLAYLTGKWVRTRTLIMRQASSRLTATLQEYLTGVRILRLFGRAPDAVEQVKTLSEDLRKANLSETRLRLGLQPVYSVLVTSGIVVVVWLGGNSVVEGTLTTGALVAFMQLYIRFVGRGHRIPLFFNRIQSAGVAYARIEKMLAPPEPRDSELRFSSFRPGYITGIDQTEPKAPPSGTGALSVSMTGMTFRYPGSDHAALDDITLTIPAGSLTAITGPIGSGKTAFLQVIAGLYAPLSGSVSLGDRPVSSWEKAERSVRVAYLPQDPGLFSGTVRENIGLDVADPALEARIIAQAGLEQDVAQFPDGLDTLIGEGGIRISGGQRQRIALARAIAVGGERTPGILLLDDPFASVDVDTEGRIIDALRETYVADADHRATLIICSHRLAAFPHADRVIVLDKGTIEEDGTHDELISAGGMYAKIYQAQHRIERPGRQGEIS